MGIEAIDHNDAGALVVPETRTDWEGWVSASRTRNWCDRDPLLDWLDVHGRAKGFVPDTDLPVYDPSLDFSQFIMAQGQRFEAAVIAHLGTLIPIRRIAEGWEEVQSLDAARETFAAMHEGIPVIAQGVLRNAETRTYGAADLLVRSDILAGLFPGAIAADEADLAAPSLGGRWHYRVIDIKFTTLHFAANGHADNGHLKYMTQVHLYNAALGRLQGYLPAQAYLLGRGWQQGDARGRNCLERLAPVDQAHILRTRGAVAQVARDAVEWVRSVRAEGEAWDVLPEPSLPELRPHATNTEDQPWHQAKSMIARELGDLTLLWKVGPDNRNAANARGLLRWDDPACTAAAVGVGGAIQGPVLDAVIAVNRDTDTPPIQPARVSAAEDQWREPGPVEFYVDFEWVSNLADDFSAIPEQGGQELIFMVGCGHLEEGQWRFRCFIADDLSEEDEAAMLDSWFAHMSHVGARLAPGTEPRVFHWSPAETISFETQYRSATARHPEKDWPHPNWFDLLANVVRAEPVVVRGAMGFGLKPFATAMHSFGLIKTLWADGVVDGMGAMVGAWRCAEEARSRSCTLLELPLMQAIRDYNEIDCKVMMEIVAYLRANH